MSVRVRFAPSPTGFLHIGNARAALLNYLFARANQGLFILRLDDTDQVRSEDIYTDALKQDLAWLGLEHGLYFKQSDRFDRYSEVKTQLIESGRLYACYETPEELDFKRKRQLTKGLPPLYDRESLSLTPDQIKKYEAEGRTPHWRFKMHAGKISWNDLVRGTTEFNAADISDPVLIRADGTFLYSITSVIDDFDYKITHIIRGEDHVTNSAAQIQIFEALNGDKPYSVEFAHTTLLVGEDGHPLSKRLGSLSLHNLRDDGIEPMAINSLLARLGSSLPVEPKLTLEELSKGFNFDHFSKTPPRFSETDLKILNHKLFHQMPFFQIQERLEKLGITKITVDAWNILHDNIETLSDLKEWEGILFGDLVTSCDEAYAEIALNHLPSAPFTEESWKEWTLAIRAETGKKGKELYMPLRLALTGKEHGPEMSRLIMLMGYDLICTRLKSHIRI